MQVWTLRILYGSAAGDTCQSHRAQSDDGRDHELAAHEGAREGCARAHARVVRVWVSRAPLRLRSPLPLTVRSVAARSAGLGSNGTRNGAG